LKQADSVIDTITNSIIVK